MKALALRQPWAWLVVNGYKDIEHRSWSTRLCGRIWVHASSRRVTKAEHEHFLTIVEIVDCVTASRSYWFSGDYGFVLRNARKTPFRPTRGKLGFFAVQA